ncbi:MAG TPA: glycosyltransferase family 2 protein, partial [Candidatus Bathyarchaeia archaeon]|nr:glycosyltransferase family 2 protein [Candidatus Bathyarchaeia archaeon]
MMCTIRYMWVVFLCVHSFLCSRQQRIAVVIPSYNNAKWCQENLRSVLAQTYENYYVMYTSDCSTDGMDEIIENFLARNDHEKRVTFVKNKVRRGALYNLYRMIHQCDDDDIVLTLDGDDMFAHEHVLEKINEVYAAGDIWLTYGQFKFLNSDATGWTCPMPEDVVRTNTFREFSHMPSHLRTFKAWLFKEIRLKDLLYLGDFYLMTWDMVMMLPMIEMAGERHQFIADILYLYNDSNPLSDHMISRQLQAYLGKVVRAVKRYERMAQKPIRKKKEQFQATVMIFSDGDIKKTALTLKSVYGYVSGFDKVIVLYTGDLSRKNEIAYHALQKNFPLVQYRATNYENFSENFV